MNTAPTLRRTPGRPAPNPLDALPENARQLLEPLAELAEASDYLATGSVGTFTADATHYSIPRFAFLGPPGGGETIRLGIFAAIHGNEVEGAAAAVEFLRHLAAAPRLATGYHVYVYPVCNPSGFEDQTPHARFGRDLFAEFWRGSVMSEVYYLERELATLQFAGVVLLRRGRQADGLQALSHTGILTEALARPATEAAAAVLPAAAKSGATPVPATAPSPLDFVRVLTDSTDLAPVPFEIVLEMPRLLPQPLVVQSVVAALKSILDSYCSLQAIRPNI